MGDPGRTSKKRSGASSKSRPPEPLEFFIDRSLGRNLIADALKQAGHVVHIHDDHFKQDEEDAVWLKAVGARRWIILSKDKMIRRRFLERDALIHASARAFFLGSGNLTGEEMARAFVAALPP